MTDIKEDEQDRDEQQLFGFAFQQETIKIEETRVKTHNQRTVLPNGRVYQEQSYSTPNTPEQRNPEVQVAENSQQK